jgi:hypothetical protein
MNDGQSTQLTGSIDRRVFLTSVGVAGLTGLAGCSGGDGDNESNPEQTESNGGNGNESGDESGDESASDSSEEGETECPSEPAEYTREEVPPINEQEGPVATTEVPASGAEISTQGGQLVLEYASGNTISIDASRTGESPQEYDFNITEDVTDEYDVPDEAVVALNDTPGQQTLFVLFPDSGGSIQFTVVLFTPNIRPECLDILRLIRNRIVDSIRLT